MTSKIENIRRELVALKRSIDPHLTDPRRYEILRDDLDPIWGRLEALLHMEESEIPNRVHDLCVELRRYFDSNLFNETSDLYLLLKEVEAMLIYGAVQ